MGKVLQIRVWATTYNEADVAREWPRLHQLAWADANADFVAKQGVLEMVDTLVDAHRFADWPPDVKSATTAGIQRLADLRRQLDTALEEWDPATANRLSDAIEDQLSVLEKNVPKA